MATAQRRYGGASADERRAKRRALLIEAGLDVLAADGWERVTVRAICGNAGLNDRYFYESFSDRDDLLLAALDDQISQGIHATSAALDSAPQNIRARSRAVIEAGIGFLIGDPRRGTMLIESQATDVLRRRRNDLVRMLATIAADQARDLLGEHAAPEVDIELVALTLVSGGLELLTMWLRGDLNVTREHLADFLVALLLTNADIAGALERETRHAPATPVTPR